MDNEYITMQFHNEYAQRMKEEHDRQNHRLEALETAVEENRDLALSIERLTLSVKSMVEEQKRQGDRLSTLENRDGEQWRHVVSYIITAVIGIVVGFIFKRIGL